MAAEYEASGLSRQEFCDQHGVPLKILARYLTRFRREENGNDGTPQWVADEVAGRNGNAGELAVVLVCLGCAQPEKPLLPVVGLTLTLNTTAGRQHRSGVEGALKEQRSRRF